MSSPSVLNRATRLELENGMILHQVPQEGLPLVTISIRFRAGAALDPDGQEGIAELTTRLLRKGSTRYSATQLEDLLDGLGAEVSEGLDHDGIDIEGEFLTDDFRKGLSILFEICFRPTFPTEEVEKARRLLLNDIAGLAEDPDELADLFFASEFYLPHPYGRSEWGSARSVRRIERESLVRFHEERFFPANAILAVSGDLAGIDVPREVERGLPPELRRKRRDLPAIPAFPGPAPLEGQRLVAVHKPGLVQSHIRIGGPGLRMNDPALDTVEVANTLFGGSFTSSLMEEVRVKRGLSYDISSGFDAGWDLGAFLIETFTKHGTVKETIRLILELLERFRRERPSPEHLEKAINYRLGMFDQETETADDVAEELIDIEFYGLGPMYLSEYRERIRAITQEDLHRVAQDFFPHDQLLMVVVTDIKRTKEQLQALHLARCLHFRTGRPVSIR